MQCPNCAWDKTSVIHTRKYGPYTIRERRCMNCNQIFHTAEAPVSVAKYDEELMRVKIKALESIRKLFGIKL